jgi:cell division protein FtsL
MGNYNSEYESYYNSLNKNGRATYAPSYNNKKNFKESKKIRGSYLGKRIIRDLVGVLILFTFIIGCRVVVTPKTQAIYKYSKGFLNQSYDYVVLEKEVKNIDWGNLQNKIISKIGQLKSKINLN